MKQSVSKSKLFKNLAFFLAILAALSATLVSGNAQRPKSRPVTSNNAIYAFPRYWPEQKVAMFEDSKTLATNFGLITSWVPGDGMNGVMRYQLYAYPIWQDDGKRPNSDDIYGESIEKYVRRIHACTIYLDLIDVYGFNLRAEEINFRYGANDKGRIIEADANSSIAMSIDEYKILLKGTQGYNIRWNDSDRIKP